ncbi:16S rRNA (uracil(1498)-N(3))-methyltransferase [candidate division KSB1 bacterium]|nr:16S rRNA (uracil(1498)-N(3))-methyltransferase [candidate division KSB1 bacterium]RQW06242.1 MAG: 16S rRNA (uracil(1498)-N(3))-methyltransferase [candidate division KSB1 bacterium]
MNLILFDAEETDKPIPLQDERAQHILNLLKLKPGDRLRVGLLNGPKGCAFFRRAGSDGLILDFTWEEQVEPPPDPLTLIIGLSRPHTNQKILQQAAAIGVRRMLFVRTELGEGSYAASKLWVSGEYKRHLILGAQQARSTHIPVVEFGTPLWIAMHLVEDISQKIVLHHDEGAPRLTRINILKDESIVLAIGAERGWTENEMAMFRRNGFSPAMIGDRVLRTETAVVAALTLVKAAIGAW